LLTTLLRRLNPLPRRSRKPVSQSRRDQARLRLEALEDRCLPSYTIADLGTLGGPARVAYAINKSGQACGSARTANGSSHAFILQNGQMTDLGTFGGQDSSALAVNNFGQVVGSDSTAGGQQRAFAWQNGQETDLGTLGGQRSFASGVNDSGQ